MTQTNPFSNPVRSSHRTSIITFWALQGVVICVLLWYLKYIGFFSVMAKIASLKLQPFIIGTVLIILITLFRPWRSWVMLKSIGLLIGWWQLFRWSQEAWFLSLITPGKIGDLYRAYRIEKEFSLVGAGLLSTILEKWIDLAFLLVIGIVGILLKPPHSARDVFYLSSIIFSGLLLITGAVIVSDTIRAFIIMIVSLIPWTLFRNVMDRIIFGLGERFRLLRWGTIIQMGMISLFIWVVYIVGFNFLFLSLDIHMDLFPFISCLAIVWLVQAIPVTFFGLGSREAVLVFYMGQYGFSSVEAISVSFLFLATYCLSMAISALFWAVRQNPRMESSLSRQT
jgi:uncharacterized membrane protein YbhN (UPF0104 family)